MMVALSQESQQQADGLSLRLDAARDLSRGTVVHPSEPRSKTIVRGMRVTLDQRPGVMRATRPIPGIHPPQDVVTIRLAAGDRCPGPPIVVVRGHKAAQVDVLAETTDIETSLSLHWAEMVGTKGRVVDLSDSQKESAVSVHFPRDWR